MHPANRHSALSTRRRAALHRPCPHVARREHSRSACLQRAGSAFQSLPGRSIGDIGARFDEALLVALDLRREPLRARPRADQPERSAVEESRCGTEGFATGSLDSLDMTADAPAVVRDATTAPAAFPIPPRSPARSRPVAAIIPAPAFRARSAPPAAKFRCRGPSARRRAP